VLDAVSHKSRRRATRSTDATDTAATLDATAVARCGTERIHFRGCTPDVTVKVPRAVDAIPDATESARMAVDVSPAAKAQYVSVVRVDANDSPVVRAAIRIAITPKCIGITNIQTRVLFI